MTAPDTPAHDEEPLYDTWFESAQLALDWDFNSEVSGDEE